MRSDSTLPSQSASATTPTADAAVTLTELKDPTDIQGKGVDETTMVDKSESTPLPSPRSKEQYIVLDYDDDALLPIKTSLFDSNIEVNLLALASAATTHKSAARRGEAASQLVECFRPCVETLTHNGSDIDKFEPKAPPTSREHAQSVSQFSRIERG